MNFIHNQWHAWPCIGGFYLSDENAKKLRQFKTIDDVINWLYLSGEKDAARAFNKMKGLKNEKRN